MELLTSNNVWMMICTALVFFMHLGFSFLEIGLTRQKNTINILFKNFFVITMGLLVYCGFGFNLMYPGEFGIIDGVLGFAGFGLDPGVDYDQLTYAGGGYTYWTDAFLYVSFIYPVVGSWQWGGGFFSTFISDELGFYDFAGSTLVHSVGGWGALVAIYFLGARKGKFDSDGKPLAIPGSNLPISAAGVLILWLGWFGFNGGSVLSADPALTSLTLVTTCLAAAAGGIGAAVLSGILYKNLDLTMFMNGVLGGLVGITAGADQMLPHTAILIGIIAGGIVVLSVALLDKCKLDDPVGAIPVHLFCGIWGTLAVGLFGELAGFNQFMVQLACVGITGAFCVIGGTIITLIVKSIVGLRVEEKEEEDGLDIAEHGTRAYGDFSIN
jgi:Amt family ammonium transporter